MINFEKIDNILAGEPKFRQKQVEKLVFGDLIENWDKAMTLPAGLREKLNQECPLDIDAEIFVSKDGKTAKILLVLADGLKIESVLMRHDKRNTVCVSSQAGCSLDCVFCATGKAGFKRNLSAGEIVAQVLFWARLLALERSDGGQARWLKKNRQFARVATLPRDCHAPAVAGARNDEEERGYPAKSGFAGLDSNRGFDRVNNVVFMGMGEPMLNYDNVAAAIKILNSPSGLAIGKRHISISTVGIIEGIAKMAQDLPQVNLAISLHAPNNELRQKLMPVNKKYPIEKILAAVGRYTAQTRRRVMFEYIMIKSVNDSDICARELAGLLSKKLSDGKDKESRHLGLYFVNLITYNPTGIFKPSPPERVKKFKEILERAGIQTLQRYRFGQDIKGACGQLAGDYVRI
jgi:23S rRNA (adenine2503-C2)-methyltransferase